MGGVWGSGVCEIQGQGCGEFAPERGMRGVLDV